MSKYRHYSDEEKLRLINECRRSGLSDHQWCYQNNIPSSTFYNWVVKLRNNACSIPSATTRLVEPSVKQEVVKVDIVQETPITHSVSTTRKNVINEVSIEIQLNGCNVRVYNAASQEVISNVITVLKGALC